MTRLLRVSRLFSLDGGIVNAMAVSFATSTAAILLFIPDDDWHCVVSSPQACLV